MSDTTTPAERMEKALARAQAFVKLHGHDNTACITSGELFLFRDALKCAQTEIEHWGKLYLMMTKDEQRLTKMADWLAERCAEHCNVKTLDACAVDPIHCKGIYCTGATPEEWQEAARRAVGCGRGGVMCLRTTTKSTHSPPHGCVS